MTEPGYAIFYSWHSWGIVERLFLDRKWVLLRYAVIHMREILGWAGILPDSVARNSSGKNLRRWPGAEFVILPALQTNKTYDTHTNVIPS